jgi:hypothetical protein
MTIANPIRAVFLILVASIIPQRNVDIEALGYAVGVVYFPGWIELTELRPITISSMANVEIVFMGTILFSDAI